VDEPVSVLLDPKSVHIFDSREGHALRRNGPQVDR
jgi:hypothetical protein